MYNIGCKEIIGLKVPEIIFFDFVFLILLLERQKPNIFMISGRETLAGTHWSEDTGREDTGDDNIGREDTTNTGWDVTNTGSAD